MKEKKIPIIIYECIGGDSAVATEDGNTIYERIEKALNKEISVQIDFKNIQLITTTFLNAAIGQLYGKYTGDTLNEKLELLNLEKSDMATLRKVIKVSKQYFEDKKKIEKIIDEELDK